MKETTVTGYSERFSIFSFVKSEKYSSFIKLNTSFNCHLSIICFMKHECMKTTLVSRVQQTPHLPSPAAPRPQPQQTTHRHQHTLGLQPGPVEPCHTTLSTSPVLAALWSLRRKQRPYSLQFQLQVNSFTRLGVFAASSGAAVGQLGWLPGVRCVLCCTGESEA